MTLDVVCPKCDFRMHLPMNMAGRSIRCPNPDCNTSFEVPPPIAEVVSVVKPKPAPKPPQAVSKPKPKPVPTSKPKEVRWSDGAEPQPKEVRWSDAEPPVAQPKEVRWDDEVAPKPQPKPIPRVRPSPARIADVEDDTPILSTPRKKRQSRSPMILAGLVVALLFCAVGLGVYAFISRERDERRLADAAQRSYDSGDYAAARRNFVELANNYPGSEHEPRYRFFEALSQLQSDVQRLGPTAPPEDAMASFASFLEQNSDSPFMKPGSGSGNDLVILGQKLAGVAHEYSEAQLKLHRRNRTDFAPLDTSEMVAKRGRALLAELERFRDKDSPSSKDILQKFDTFEPSARLERERSMSLVRWRDKLTSPDQSMIDDFLTAIASAGLGDDPHALAMVDSARRAITDRIRFVPARRGSIPFPESEPLKFTLQPIPGSTTARKPEGQEQTCFGLSQGCLIAVDANTGASLWGRRIGSPSLPRCMLDLPSVAKLPDSNIDLALVAFPNGLGAFKLRSGESIWFQTLPGGCRANPVVNGGTVYAACLDDAGTIAALDLRTGEFLGSIALEQPHGANLQYFRNSNGMANLVAVGLARQVYLFQIVPGDMPSLAYRGSMVTGHAASSILVDPLIVSPVGTTTSPRMILTMANGTGSSKLTEYVIPTTVDEMPAKESPAQKLTEKTLIGWPWLPMTCDGERFAFTTDSGTVGWYGWKYPAEGVYPLLPEPVTEMGDALSRSCVATMTDDSLWVIVGENLVRYQASVGAPGLRMIPVGKPRRLGEAVGRPQVYANMGVVVVPVKPSNGLNRLVAFDSDRGEVVWQAELKVE